MMGTRDKSPDRSPTIEECRAFFDDWFADPKKHFFWQLDLPRLATLVPDRFPNELKNKSQNRRSAAIKLVSSIQRDPTRVQEKMQRFTIGLVKDMREFELSGKAKLPLNAEELEKRRAQLQVNT